MAALFIYEKKIMWLIFALATTFIWGLAELFYKKGASPDEKYAHLKICVCVGFVMGLHAIVTLMLGDIHYDPRNIILYLPVSCCYILSMSLSFFGMRFIEESISDPIENTSGAICSMLCAIFLHTTIPGQSVAAIILIVIGILGIGFLENRGGTDRKKKIGKKLAMVAFAMPFCYAILDALGSFLDIYYLEVQTSPLSGVDEANIEMVANTTYELTFLICAILILIFLKIRHVPFNISGKRDGILAAICETAGQFTYVFAMSGNGAIAAPIISSVCIVSLLLSRIVLKEKLTGKQYMFLAFVIVGILLLAIFE